ncbi:MAG: enoyl-CoA hydratase/isomerase family protein [Bernardetiaceae bacterium]|nr:enoyl-CoA hydratase/isomerase family protein [Bernardetiaceae bacterium]
MREFETLHIEQKKNYAILKLNRGRSNPINRQMIRDLHEAALALEAHEEIYGVIMTGGDGFFSSGLDLIELYDLDSEGVAEFWTAFIEMTKHWVGFSKPLIAAISGHSPAGGCVMATCCDYRVMAKGGYGIGLNEVPVGIVVPELIFDLYAFWIGKRKAYQFLLEGKLLSPEAAFEVGLVDELAAPEDLLKRAEKKMATYLEFDPMTWQMSKKNLRTELLRALDVDLTPILEPLLKQWWSPRTRAILKHLIDSLFAKKK